MNLASKVLQAAGHLAQVIVAPFTAREYLLFAGLGLAAYGLSMIYPPAAFLAPGTVLVLVAIFGVR